MKGKEYTSAALKALRYCKPYIGGKHYTDAASEIYRLYFYAGVYRLIIVLLTVLLLFVSWQYS